MKQPLRTVCALLFAGACCAAQTSGAAEKIPTNPTTPAPAQAVAPVAAPPASAPAVPQDNKPLAAPPTTNPSAVPVPPGPDALKPGCEPEKPPADAASGKPYVIGALDVLAIKVWNSKELSDMYDVGPDGTISMPLIGQLKADGVTVGDLTRTIRGRLAVSVFECPPEVNVQVVRVNSKKFFILGGVNRPGEYPLTGEMTVLDAFANCGGFHDFANPKKIYILRGDKKIPFNYKDVIKGKNMKQNIALQNGDHIVVPE